MRLLLARALVICCLMPLLSACASEGGVGSAPMRVIISFDAARTTDDPRLLADLKTAAGVRVEYAAAISPRAAAYRLHCPAADAGCENSLARLRVLPGVSGAQPDRLMENRK